MRNKYKGFCPLCKKEVLPGEGHFERQKGFWITKHAECVIKDRKNKK